MRLNPLWQLTPGERAFDWCVAWFFLGMVVMRFVHLPFAIGIVLAAYWIWALRAVAQSWSDPVARVLRFSSAVLLAAQLIAICTLLSQPWMRVWHSSDSQFPVALAPSPSAFKAP